MKLSLLYYMGLYILLPILFFGVLGLFVLKVLNLIFQSLNSLRITYAARKIKSKSVSVNQKSIFGTTPLMGVARCTQDTAELKQVIQDGGDVNAVDTEGRTALMAAVQYNLNHDITRLLIAVGGDITVTTPDHETLLMIAATHNTNPEIIKVLLKAGLDVNDVDKHHCTALMKAAQYNPNPAVVAMLLKSGASRDIISDAGKTAFDYAHENIEINKTEVFKSLKNA